MISEHRKISIINIIILGLKRINHNSFLSHNFAFNNSKCRRLRGPRSTIYCIIARLKCKLNLMPLLKLQMKYITQVCQYPVRGFPIFFEGRGLRGFYSQNWKNSYPPPPAPKKKKKTFKIPSHPTTHKKWEAP